MTFVIDFKERRNDKTYFVFNFGSLPGIYTVLLDQHNGLKTITLKLKLQWEAVFLTQLRSLSDERVFWLHNLLDGSAVGVNLSRTQIPLFQANFPFGRW
jgi:hypothetical protein